MTRRHEFTFHCVDCAAEFFCVATGQRNADGRATNEGWLGSSKGWRCPVHAPKAAHAFTGRGKMCNYDWPDGDELSSYCNRPRSSH